MTSGNSGFPPAFRLATAAEFKFVFDQAIKSSDCYLTVLARRNTKEFARLGLAVSKKSVRRAVDRNRIKRLIRESFRLNRQQIGNFDLVVLTRSGAATADRQAIRQALQKHWEVLIRRCNSR